MWAPRNPPKPKAPASFGIFVKDRFDVKKQHKLQLKALV